MTGRLEEWQRKQLKDAQWEAAFLVVEMKTASDKGRAVKQTQLHYIDEKIARLQEFLVNE